MKSDSENSRLRRKKRIAIVTFALVGAAAGDSLILLDQLTFSLWKSGHLSRSWNDFFGGLAWLQAIIGSGISSACGIHGGFLNQYVVNGILGAAIFAFAGWLWQLRRKN